MRFILDANIFGFVPRDGRQRTPVVSGTMAERKQRGPVRAVSVPVYGRSHAPVHVLAIAHYMDTQPHAQDLAALRPDRHDGHDVGSGVSRHQSGDGHGHVSCNEIQQVTRSRQLVLTVTVVVQSARQKSKNLHLADAIERKQRDMLVKQRSKINIRFEFEYLGSVITKNGRIVANMIRCGRMKCSEK